jgi:hypothetical protein
VWVLMGVMLCHIFLFSAIVINTFILSMFASLLTMENTLQYHFCL